MAGAWMACMFLSILSGPLLQDTGAHLSPNAVREKPLSHQPVPLPQYSHTESFYHSFLPSFKGCGNKHFSSILSLPQNVT